MPMEARSYSYIEAADSAHLDVPATFVAPPAAVRRTGPTFEGAVAASSCGWVATLPVARLRRFSFRYMQINRRKSQLREPDAAASPSPVHIARTFRVFRPAAPLAHASLAQAASREECNKRHLGRTSVPNPTTMSSLPPKPPLKTTHTTPHTCSPSSSSSSPPLSASRPAPPPPPPSSRHCPGRSSPATPSACS